MRLPISSLLVMGLVACTAARTSAVSESPAAHAKAPLPFIEDDYSRALSEAKSRGLPLFVDTWAPW
ncbi:hypothetical protein [Archangium sp.]|jgi:hypothetical protein|uniref:hypothetical protein n=1 Tax=Archangium sp. TaxID=1872627 RepID=UPI002EDBA55E